MSNSTGIVPASVPPDGVTPDFENPEDVYYTGNLVNLAVCTGLINIVFFLHAYVKLVVRRTSLLHEDCKFPKHILLAIRIDSNKYRVLHCSVGMFAWKIALVNTEFSTAR